MAKNKDLETLIAELHANTLSDKDYKILSQTLALLGLKIYANEFTREQKISVLGIKPKKSPPPIYLSNYFKHINALQFKHIARRFNPAAKAVRLKESQKVVRNALVNPKLLTDMIANLKPLERRILLEAKRLGGKVNGWILITFAVLSGFKPRVKSIRDVYGKDLTETEFVGFIAELLRDGLLIPKSNKASWFYRYGYYYSSENQQVDDIVLVDERILDCLPNEISQPKLSKLDLTPVKASPVANHPVKALLELNEVLNLILEQGGLQFTQAGFVSKTAFKRFIKARPWLEPNLENMLAIAMQMGFLQKPAEKSNSSNWQVNLSKFHLFQLKSLSERYKDIITGFLNTKDQDDDDWGNSSSDLVSLTAARQVLLESLIVLPEHPVKLNDALLELWKLLLHHTVKASYSFEDQGLPVWFTEEILGNFKNLGFVATIELPRSSAKKATKSPKKLAEDDDKEEQIQPSCYAIMPALGFEWYRQSKQQTDNSAFKSEAIANKASEKPLLIQANYEILVYLDKLSAWAITALNCADCTRIDSQTATYTLSRSSIYRTLETGLPLDQIVAALENHSSGIPSNVTQSLHEWASRRERLSFQENISLLEYSSKTERNKALKTLTETRTDIRAIADRFIAAPKIPRKLTVSNIHNYRTVPKKIIHFQSDGSFDIKGAIDLAGRTVIAKLAQKRKDGRYQLNIDLIRQAGLKSATSEALIKRTVDGLPDYIQALVDIWQGKQKNPVLAKVSLFQHPYAFALAEHPDISEYLAGSLGESSFIVKQGAEKKLEKVLKALGVTTDQDIDYDLKAEDIQEATLEFGLATRKMREMITEAIAQKQLLFLNYYSEKVKYNRYGYPEKSKGEILVETVIPKKIEYEASTPYFSGKTKEGQDRWIRIGYIQGIGVH